jgi:hypothetical protein
VGENTVKVTVTAENGNREDYVIRVTRTESELAGVTVKVGEKDYTVEHDPVTLAVPRGFTRTTAVYGERNILAYASQSGSVLIAFLKGESNADWYVYDPQLQVFSLMQTVQGQGLFTVILPAPSDWTPPYGWSACQLTVDRYVISAYQSVNSTEKGIYLVYAMMENGTVDWYYYDSVHQNFLSYFESPLPEAKPVGGDPSQNLELENRWKEAQTRALRMEVIALLLGILSVLLAICSVLLFVFRRRAKRAKEDFRDETLILLEENNQTRQIPNINEVYDYGKDGRSEKK